MGDKMKKLFLFAFVLLLAGGTAFADLQIDRGQTRGQAGAVSKFFVGRNAREGTLISADRVVIWDTTSNDGVSVTTTTTSYDNLVAGVTIDAIPGVTSDATAAANLSQSNYGRIRVYGRHADVSFDTSSNDCSAGARIAAHNIAGTATAMNNQFGSTDISSDVLTSGISFDAFGVALEACAAANTTLDVFIQKG